MNVLKLISKIFSVTSRQLGGIALIMVLTVGTFAVAAPMQGCSITKAQVQGDAIDLANALTSLAAVIQPTDPAIAAKLDTAAAALTAAANGTGSGPTWEQVLNAAAASAEVILAAIPITAPFASLVAIAVTAAELIITNTIGSTGSVKALPEASAQNLVWYTKTGNSLIKHRALRSVHGDVKAAWNSEAKKLGYSKAVV